MENPDRHNFLRLLLILFLQIVNLIILVNLKSLTIQSIFENVEFATFGIFAFAIVVLMGILIITQIRQMFRNRKNFSSVVSSLLLIFILFSVGFIAGESFVDYARIQSNIWSLYDPSEYQVFQVRQVQGAVDSYYRSYGRYPDNYIDPQKEFSRTFGKAGYGEKHIDEKNPESSRIVFYRDIWGSPFQYDAETGYVYTLGKSKKKSPDTDSKKRVVGEGNYDAKMSPEEEKKEAELILFLDGITAAMQKSAKVSLQTQQMIEVQQAVDDHYKFYGKYPDNYIDPQKRNYRSKKTVEVYSIDSWGTPFQYDKESGYVYSLGEDKIKNEGTDTKKRVAGDDDYDAKSR